MRIFVFVPQIPYPAKSGGRIVTCPLVEELSRLHEVHLFTLTHGEAEEKAGIDHFSNLCAGVYTAPGTSRIDIPVLGRSFFSRYPYKVHRFTSRELAQKAARAAEKHPPDVIHCQNFYMALYARDLAARCKVLYQENFETLLLERWCANAANPILRRMIQIEARRTRNFEMECPVWFDWLATISGADEMHYRQAAEMFPGTRDLIHSRIVTVRPGIDLSYYTTRQEQSLSNPFPPRAMKNLVFTGMFGYEANVDGAAWMVKEVMPLLERENLSLWLVGQKPADTVRALHNPPWIHVTGAVEDIRPYLHHADLSVVPLRIGGGIRLKILEALAMGCQVVSTPVGCEGLWSQQDPPVWSIAETPADFAESIRTCLHQEVDRAGLRRWVSERFSPTRFIDELTNLYSCSTLKSTT